MYWYLFDVPKELNDKGWIVKSAGENPYRELYTSESLTRVSTLSYSKFGKTRAYLIRFKQAVKAVFLSKQGDSIVCWENGTGLILNYISTLLGNRRKIIIMNYLTPHDEGKVYSRLYKCATENPKCRNIAKTPGAVAEWNNKYKNSINNFRYIPDVYDADKICFKPYDWINGGGYCFTGGMNNRDWKLIRDLAVALPDVKFVCAVTKTNFEALVSEVPDNMDIRYQIPADEYYGLMSSAKIILLPLKYNTVSGLINIIKAAEYGVLCLCTDYEFTRQYYYDTAYLMDNANIHRWVQKIIELLYADETEYMNRSAQFQNYIEYKFSSISKAEDLKRIIDEIRID